MIVSMFRWLSVLVLVGLVAFGATEVRAQVFKPRTGKAAPAGKSAPAANAGAAAGKSSATVATAAAATSSRKQTRATGPTPRRAGTTPSAKKSRSGKHRGDSDTDDDDVKITDD